MSSTQNHSHAKSEKKELKEEKVEMVPVTEVEAEKAKCGVLAERVAALEAFIEESLKTAAFNSTTASELLKKI